MQESLNNLLQNTPYGLLIFFVALWCFVCFIISVISGWFALCRRFRAKSEPLGEIRSAGPLFYTVYMRFWGHYSGVIRLRAAGDAHFLSVLFPFRIGHPPLCIPWKEIALSRTKRLWRRYVVLMLGEQELIPMRISERMARNLGILEKVPIESTSAR
ncbi:MAG: hypothetical protein KGL37_09595 [Acidobacteriota bacterium]|nr:hypothetical protein [Acidobacteriota bacterium]